MIYMGSGDFKELARRTASDKVLRDKTFNIAKKNKYDGYQRDLALKIYKFFGKKSLGNGVDKEIKQNQQLDEELHRPIVNNI